MRQSPFDRYVLRDLIPEILQRIVRIKRPIMTWTTSSLQTVPFLPTVINFV